MSFKTLVLLTTATALGFSPAAHASPIASPDVNSNVVTLSFSDLPVNSIVWDGTLEVATGEQSTPTFSQSGSGDNTVWTITLLANQSPDSSVATDFINDSGGDYNVFSPYALLSFPPSKLSFFFGVYVCTGNANIGCFTMYLGQGTNPFDQNNWWLGSSAMISQGNGQDETAQLAFGGNTFVNVSSGGNDHSFDFFLLQSVSAIPEPPSGAILAVGLAAAFVVRRTRRDRVVS